MINGINGVDNNDLVDIQSYLEKKKKKKLPSVSIFC